MESIAELVSDDYKFTIAADEILVGIGSTPNVSGMNLEAVGVDYNKEDGIPTNDYLQTSNPRIYAAGDVCSEHKFPHIEDGRRGHRGQQRAALGPRQVEHVAIPWCTYTDPEIAHVGLYVKEARAKGIPVKTFTVMMHDVDRAITDGEDEGFVKIHVKEGTDKIIGATVAASHAGEMISEISLAMCAGIGLGALAKVEPSLSNPGAGNKNGRRRVPRDATVLADAPVATEAMDVALTSRGGATEFPRICRVSTQRRADWRLARGGWNGRRSCSGSGCARVGGSCGNCRHGSRGAAAAAAAAGALASAGAAAAGCGRRRFAAVASPLAGRGCGSG